MVELVWNFVKGQPEAQGTSAIGVVDMWMKKRADKIIQHYHFDLYIFLIVVLLNLT
jgi:hypothetical protein